MQEMLLVQLQRGNEKLASVRSQVEELRELIETAKVMLGNRLISDTIKLELIKTFPDDLTAFADGLDQILADFKNDGCEPLSFEPDADEVLGDG